MLSNKKSRIGITLRVVTQDKIKEKRDAISQDWILFSEKLDMIPILIPNMISDIESFLTEIRVDGLVLSGGDNIGDNPDRDETERKIIDFGIKNKIPIIGICRGMQVLNKYFGGSVTRIDNNSHVKNFHMINITNEKLSLFLKKKSMKVNSFHHNIIDKQNLGKDLEEFARINEDNTIEGFFHNKLPISAVMWHPERDPTTDNLEIFRQLLNYKFY